MTNLRFVLSPAAPSDLDEIWEYSADQWSADQAERYILELMGAVEDIAAGKRNGRACDEIRHG